MSTMILAGILVWISGALFGIWWKARSYKNKIHQPSYDQGYERAMVFYWREKKGDPNVVLEDWPQVEQWPHEQPHGSGQWPHGDPGDIRSYTPGPGKPRHTGPADYVEGHEMGS